jgi:hypothetical protein
MDCFGDSEQSSTGFSRAISGSITVHKSMSTKEEDIAATGVCEDWGREEE